MDVGFEIVNQCVPFAGSALPNSDNLVTVLRSAFDMPDDARRGGKLCLTGPQRTMFVASVIT
jgi:hypothetical protein